MYHMKDILYFSYTSDVPQVLLVDFKGNKTKEYKEGITFIHRLCKRYGATWKSRKQSVLLCIRGKQKIPLLLSETYKLIFFPVYGTTCKENTWIQYKKVEKIISHEEGCMIQFCNGEKLLVHVGIRSLRLQMKRCKSIYQFLCNI